MRKMLIVFAMALAALPCAAGPEIGEGDELALSGSFGWVLIRPDGTWEDVPESELPRYIHLVKDQSYTASEPVEPEPAPAEDPLADPVVRNWKYYSGADAITDIGWHLFFAPAVSGDYSSYDTPAFRVHVKDTGEAFISIFWDNYLGSSDSIQIITRLDKNPPVKDSWSNSADNTSTFFTGRFYGDKRKFMDQLITAETLTARVTPYNEAPTTAVFDISGLKEFVNMIPEAFALVQ